MSHVLTKSAKGLREASGKTQDLPEELREVLKLCRGQFVAEDLVAGVPAGEREGVASGLLVLTETGYLREVAEIDTPEPDLPVAGLPVGVIADRRLSPLAGPPGGVERRRGDEAANQLRAEFAARRGQRDDETSEQVRQAQELARKKAEAKARQEAEEKARIELEERARRELEARAKREAEEKLRLEALERERIEAEEKARRDAAERTRRAAEEQVKREAAEKAKRAAEEKARRDAEERELEAMRERIRQRQLGRRRMLAPLIALLLIIPGFGLWAIGFIPFEGKRLEFEQRAAQTLGTSVKIGSARFVPLPRPQWRLDRIAMGQGSSVVSADRIDIDVPVSALWSVPEILDRVTVVSPAVPLASLPAILGSRDAMSDLKILKLAASGLVLVGKQSISPPLTMSADIDGGRLVSIAGQGQNDELGKFSIAAVPKGALWQLDISARQCVVPFGFDLALTDCSLKAKLQANSLVVDQFAARVNNGDALYAGTVSWGSSWVANGKVELRRIEASQWASAWFKDGFVDGNGELVAEATSPEQMFAGTRLAGRFKVAPGTLVGVDLDRVVQGRGLGEQFRFDSLEGNVLLEHRRADIAGLRLISGALAAEGTLGIEADKSVRGRMAIEVKTNSSRLAGALMILGTTSKPQYQR